MFMNTGVFVFRAEDASPSRTRHLSVQFGQYTLTGKIATYRISMFTAGVFDIQFPVSPELQDYVVADQNPIQLVVV